MAVLIISGKEVFVDDEDVSSVMEYSWCIGRATPRKSYVQASTHGGRLRHPKTIRLHRFLLGLSHGDGMFVDHINGNTLDNRRCNLRLATPATNNVNKDLRCFGAYRTKSGWMSKIVTKGKTIYLGHFKTEEEARSAYRTAAKEFHGEFTRV